MVKSEKAIVSSPDNDWLRKVGRIAMVFECGLVFICLYLSMASERVMSSRFPIGESYQGLNERKSFLWRAFQNHEKYFRFNVSL